MNIQQAISASMPFAKELADKNIKLKIKTGSELDSLLNNIWYSELPVTGTTEDISNTAGFSLREIDDGAMDIVVNTIAKILQKELNFTRNIVIPAINDFRDEVKSNIDKFAVSNPASQFKIEVLDTPAPLAIEALIDDLGYYSTSQQINTPTGRMKLPELTDEELFALLETGSAVNSTIFTDWIKTLEPGTLARVWTTFFTDIHPEHDAYIKLRRTVDPTVPLIIYILAQNLLVNIHPAARVPLNEYNNVLYSVRDYAGTLLAYINEAFENYEKRNIIVLGIDSKNKEIKVYGDTYRAWLNDGGDIDAIYGIMVDNTSNRLVRNAERLNEVKDELIKSWDKYSKLQAVYHSGIIDRTLRKVYVLTFKESLKSLNEVEEEIINNLPGFRGNLVGKVEDYVSTLTTEELKDVSTCSDDIIAGIRFNYSNAKKFITEMNKAKAADSDLTPQECASIATMNLVADYLSNQISKR